MNEVGYVLSIRDYLAYLDGFPTAKVNDLVENELGVRGVIASLFPDKVEVWILDEESTFPGQLFKKTDKKLTINAGDFLLGRTINPLGVPVDGKGPLSRVRGTSLDLEQSAPAMDQRKFIDTQFISGISLIDTLIPLGKGQRQLILGDAHSGKTPFLIDVIVNQLKTDTVCIYAAIGKPITQVRSVIDTLRETGALKNTVIIAASSTDTPPLIFYTPYAGMSIAEYFQKQGKDVLIILDDLGTHAKVYRELSLLAGRSPGRESYPGDIFYTHARLLERAGKFSEKNGGGSITALPVIELNISDFTTFIPTNLMAMTDGHLLFKADLYGKGSRPAVDISVSVSRVGRQTQNRLQNLLSQVLRQILTEGSQLETISRFAGELPPQTRALLARKEMIEELNIQDPLIFIPVEIQIILYGLVFTTLLKDKESFFLKKTKQKILKFLTEEPKVKTFGKNLLQLRSFDQLVNKLELLVPRLEQICT